MKIGFTGSRTGMRPEQLAVVLEILGAHFPEITEAHHGNCIGADELFHNACVNYRIRTIGHPCCIPRMQAQCRTDETRAALPPLERNQKIVDACDELIATPNTLQEELRSGTWATIRRARKAGKPIKIIFPGGTVKNENYPPEEARP